MKHKHDGNTIVPSKHAANVGGGEESAAQPGVVERDVRDFWR